MHISDRNYLNKKIFIYIYPYFWKIDKNLLFSVNFSYFDPELLCAKNRRCIRNFHIDIIALHA